MTARIHGAKAEIPRHEVTLLSATQRIAGLPPLPLRNACTGGEPKLRTSLRLGLRDGTLFVRFDGRDAGVVATLSAHGSPLWTEDVFEVFLSPGQTPRVYYEFEVNPLGAVWHARIESPQLERGSMRVDTSWTCRGFSARVTRRPGRWSAVLRIPLTRLAESPSAVWRANFYRIDRGETDEYSAWSPTYAEPADFHVPEKFGYLRFPPSAPASFR